MSPNTCKPSVGPYKPPAHGPSALLRMQLRPRDPCSVCVVEVDVGDNRWTVVGRESGCAPVA
jgi:hypothetical protein